MLSGKNQFYKEEQKVGGGQGLKSAVKRKLNGERPVYWQYMSRGGRCRIRAMSGDGRNMGALRLNEGDVEDMIQEE